MVADFHRRLCETFPANCPDTGSDSCPEIARMIRRTLRRISRTAAAIAKYLPADRRGLTSVSNFVRGHSPALGEMFARPLPGHGLPAVARMIHRMLRGHYGGHTSPDAARKLRGRCSACGLIF